jgi:hypothetical protein
MRVEQAKARANRAENRVLFFSPLPSGSGLFNRKIFQLFPVFNRGN